MPRQKKEDKYYLGNKDLPNANMEFEWTPEMVRTLKKAKQNILYFAENFFYIVNWVAITFIKYHIMILKPTIIVF